MILLLSANLLTPSVVPLDEGRQSSAMASSLLTAIAADGMPDPSPIEVIQRHAHKQFERLGEKREFTYMLKLS